MGRREVEGGRNGREVRRDKRDQPAGEKEKTREARKRATKRAVLTTGVGRSILTTPHAYRLFSLSSFSFLALVSRFTSYIPHIMT